MLESALPSPFENRDARHVHALPVTSHAAKEIDIALGDMPLDCVPNSIRFFFVLQFDRIAPGFVITADKLREGWDWPAAYVLMSFRGSSTQMALEQILGRVLRMPQVRRKQNATLNRAYAFAVSDSIAQVAATLRDGLVQAGFERQDAEELVRTTALDGMPDGNGLEDLFRSRASVTIALPMVGDQVALPDFSAMPEATRKRIENKLDVSPETGSLTLRGEWSAKDQKALKDAFADSGAADALPAVEQAFSRLLSPSEPPAPTPSERGETFALPLLAWSQADWLCELGDAPPLEG